ncbi:MAG: HEPN domain-containing protein, partial [Spirochaetota bacterium]
MKTEKTREFRLRQSSEKIDIAKRLLSKGDCSNAVVQAYLSLFYSVRLLLLDKNEDSDDFEKIVELARKYFQPSGWLTVDAGTLLEKGRSYQDRIDRNCADAVSS